MFLIGDSHAANWYPALERLAEEGRIRLDSSTKSSCLPLETPQQFEDRPFTSCDQWREGVLERIAEVEPDLVVLASFHDPDRLMPGGQDSPETRWHDGLARTLARIDGPPVAVMRDVPTQAQAPTHCLAQNPESAGRCATPRADAFEEPLVQAEADAIAESDADAHHVDLTDYFCNDSTCPVLLGNTVIYRDQHHLTQTFSREMAEPLWQELEPLVA